MDVIASGLEACPWGLNGYGFDAYIASTPGNAVLAMSRFWVDNVMSILRAEEQFPEQCHRVRYEDMVSDPEKIAADIFQFLEVSPYPGVSAKCFTFDRERFGPADYKIWHTSKITDESVGRGWSVPADLMGLEMNAVINGLAEKLQYLPVDDSWGAKVPPADLRLPGESQETQLAADSNALVTEDSEQFPQGQLAGTMLAAGIGRVDERFSSRWRPHSDEAFSIIIVSAIKGGRSARWRIDLAGRVVTAATDYSDDTSWDIIGPADVWDELLAGRLNFSVAMRRCQIRYLDSGDASASAHDIRIGMLVDLLGLTSWQHSR